MTGTQRRLGLVAASLAGVLGLAYVTTGHSPLGVGVPNVCGIQDQAAAERTLEDAGFRVIWDSGVTPQNCWQNQQHFDSNEVVSETPEGRAARGSVIHLRWAPGLSGA
jgi:uncharacterized protein YcsI (UPF0317 family)